MNSISFPKMFKPSATVVVKDRDASAQDLMLLIASEPGELFGDPYFGVLTEKFMFDQNNYVLRDLLIDELYSKIKIL